MPGYCVQGTVGHKILSGQRKLEMEGRQIVSFIFKEDHLGEFLQAFRGWLHSRACKGNVPHTTSKTPGALF